MGNMIKLGFTLAVICMISGWSLHTINSMTKPKIAAYAVKEEEKARRAVLMPQAINLLDFPGGVYKWENPETGEKIMVPLSDLNMIDDPIEYTPAPGAPVTESELNRVQTKINSVQQVNPGSANGAEVYVMNAVKSAFLSSMEFIHRVIVPLTVNEGDNERQIFIDLKEEENTLAGEYNGVSITFSSVKDGLLPYRIGERAWAGVMNGEKITVSGSMTITKTDMIPIVPFKFYEARVGSKSFGAVFRVAPSGYAGPVQAIVGVNSEGRVNGVQVLGHAETPGLGARITEVNPTMTEKLKGKLGRKDLDPDKPWFLAQYEGLNASELVLMKDDPSGKVDAITAATVTSRALTNGIREGLNRYQTLNKSRGDL